MLTLKIPVLSSKCWNATVRYRIVKELTRCLKLQLKVEYGGRCRGGEPSRVHHSRMFSEGSRNIAAGGCTLSKVA